MAKEEMRPGSEAVEEARRKLGPCPVSGVENHRGQVGLPEVFPSLRDPLLVSRDGIHRFS